MAKPKFLSLDGVRTLVTYVKEKLATKVDKEPGKSLSDNNYSDADVAKLESIESGAQENLIESIQVNGNAQAIDQKSVNIAIPLVDATLTNSGQSADAKATGDAVAEVNQSLSQTATAIRQEFDTADNQLAQEMTQALEDLSATIPTKTSELANDSNYATTTELTNGLSTKEDTLQYGTATAEDVGKAMMPKTVADGKVTSWEFGEAGKVDDVQINGTSILENKVANIPIADANALGTVMVADSTHGLRKNAYGRLMISQASSTVIKPGVNSYNPITPYNQHESAFYGLAKVAGHDEKDSELPVGQYTDAAKTAIQSMLGIDSAIADAISDITSFEFQVVTELPATGTKGVIYLVAHTHDTNDVYDEYIWITDEYERLGTLDVDLSDYATTQYVDDELATKVDDVTVNGTSIVSNGVAEIPVADADSLGVVKIKPAYGVGIINDFLMINSAVLDEIKLGGTSLKPISPYNQHNAVFYGLAKAAGHNEKDSTLEVGTYTDEAKSAIQTMLGVDVAISSAIDNLVNTRYHVCEPGEYNSTTYIPTLAGELGIIYLVPKPIGDTGIDNDSITGTAQIGTATIAATNNIFYEYIYTGTKFEQIGDTKVDLTGYLTNADIATDASVTTMLNQVFS